MKVLTIAGDGLPSAGDSRILKLLQEARQQLELERRRRSEPIAIVGIGCRFPGGISNPAEFRQLLRDGVDATSEVPRERWDAEALYNPDPDEPGKLYVKRGSFLRDIENFEPEFFGISPREALGMDPQQRLLLEVTWEALEDAGIPAHRLRGTATGVWVGFCLDDYARRSILSGDRALIDAYSALGNARSIAAGRIAYVLDLRGPAIQIDTACSSSLVAVHQACSALRSGECDFALVGGVNVMSSPESTIALCKMRALSADGRCKTFDASADGYGRGDGCGMLVLQRLSDARAAGNHSYALIRGSAINQDGHSNGLTAPSGIAQEAVIRAALINAGVEAQNVGYVEAHGTGTPLGDPIEVLALDRVYGAGRRTPLYVGAVKTNFGHLEGAAGVAGLIKTALCLSSREILPTLHQREPNPRIPWADLSVRVASQAVDWAPRHDSSRYAGVSSFGISGTNAHVILEEAPLDTPEPSAPARSAELVLLSAQTPQALDAVAQRLLEHLEAHPDFTLGDVAFSLLTRRSIFDQRLALAAPSRSALLDALRLATQGQTPPGAHRAVAPPTHGRMAWLFTGQGAQILGMGRPLYAEWPVFRAAFDLVCSLFDPLLDLPLRQVMWAGSQSPDAALLDQTGFTQPALFAIEWALASLWRSLGVEPDLLLGHSIGEITAAAVAGVFSLEEACRLVAARARLMQALPAGGAMLSIAASEDVVQAAISPFVSSVSLAAANGPASFVIAGKDADLTRIADGLASRGIRAKRLSVSHAFHSPLMDPMLADFQKVAAAINYHRPQIPLVSNLSGALADDLICSPEYWTRHVRNTVRFASGVQTLAQLGAQSFLEIGPRPTLLGLVPACLPDRSPTLLPSLRPPRSEPEAFLETLAAWVARGGTFTPLALFPAGGRRLPLPRYPWQKQKFWIAEKAELQEASKAEEAFFRIEWQRRALHPSNEKLSGRWALVALEGAPPDRLLSTLVERGAAAKLVELQGLEDAAADHVLCVWDRELSSAAAMRSVSQGLSMLRALSAKADPPHLWWVTRRALGISPKEDGAPASAALWGLARSVMQEHPALQITLLDIDDHTPIEELLRRELAAGDGENQIGWRLGERHVARLVRAASDAAGKAPRELRTDGTLLVTGGLGALGFAVAKSFAERGVEHLLLTSRRGDHHPEAAAAIEHLQALGARVTVAKVDVTDRSALEQMLAHIPPHLPLRGVIHSAGIVDDAALAEQTTARAAAVLAPKVGGAWNLHLLTEHLDLDLFVLFSSLAGTLGSAGQANYAAASAYLDALAAYRQDRGLPALSLGWGPWAGSGMAAALDSRLRARFARQGIRLISPEQGVSLFHAALQRHAPHQLVAFIDVQILAASLGSSAPPILRSLAPAPPNNASNRWLEELLRLTEDERLEAVTRLVRQEVATIGSFATLDSIPRDQPLKDLGLDSLMAVELRNALARRIGRPLPATLVFDQPTPARIAQYILESARLLERKAPKAPSAASSEEAIAIVGIGCRFPGDVNDLASFWKLLDDGRDVVTEMPPERWNVDALYDPNPDAPGKMTTREGGFLREVRTFDASFFGISPREARKLDPQQRLLLETSWEAFEQSGIKAETLNGSKTGVFVGLNYHEYASLIGGLEDLDGYVGTGTAGSVASGRISYVFGLEGPSLTVDTACSSSLVTMHLACQSLRSGECSLALAGGATLILTPATFVEFSRLRGLAPDGRCRTFSADAAGTGWAEGCGMLVLERLSDARKNGHTVLALIRGSAVNQDGRSNGLTAPNGPSQEAVILEALRRANIAPSEIGYVECHGTATKLGDPVEVQALGAALSRERSLDQPVLIGSVKTNFGHTQAAAGAAGVIKTVLALQHGRIPQSLHFSDPNPLIAWDTLPVRVASKPVEWPRSDRRRYAGVSSFGISGTNAHVILEEAPLTPTEPSAPARSAELVLLSAKTPQALAAVAQHLQDHLEAHPDFGLGDLAYSLLATRSLLDHRLALSVPSRSALLDALRVAAQGQTPAGAHCAEAQPSRGKTAWLFTGQGAQLAGMGKQLSAEWPVFCAALDHVCSLFDPLLNLPLRQVMWAEPGSPHAPLLDQTGFTQPALFALQWALVALWRSFGVEPDFLLGHSIGEITAAAVAGVFSLEDAVRLVAARARLMQALPPGGAMYSIAAAEDVVLAAIRPFASTVSLAAINGPTSVVIAGTEAHVAAVAEALASRGIATKRLAVSHAFHSPLLEPMLTDFQKVAESIEYHPSRIPLISNVAGALADSAVSTPSYWVRQIRDAVRFAPGIQVLARRGVDTFIEFGPRPVLLGLVPACLPPEAQPVALLASLRPHRPEPEVLLQALGGWVARGGNFDADTLFPSKGRRLPLPNYPWQKRTFWIETPTESKTPDLAKELPGGPRWLPGQQTILPGQQTIGATSHPTASELETLGEEERSNALQQSIKTEFARISGSKSDELSEHVPLKDLGLESLMAVELRTAIELRTGLTLPATFAFEGETLRTIAIKLASMFSENARSPTINRSMSAEVLRSVRRPRARLFCFHDGGGNSRMFTPFAALAGSDVEVHAISVVRGRSAPSAGDSRSYLEAARDHISAHADAPYALFGHSLGGLFAFRVVEELVSAGRAAAPAFCAVSSTPFAIPGTATHLKETRGILESLLAKRFASPGDLTSFRAAGDWDVGLFNLLPPGPPSVSTIPILAIAADGDPLADSSRMQEWRRATTGPFTLETLPGDHLYIYEEGPRQRLMATLKKHLLG